MHAESNHGSRHAVGTSRTVCFRAYLMCIMMLELLNVEGKSGGPLRCAHTRHGPRASDRLPKAAVEARLCVDATAHSNFSRCDPLIGHPTYGSTPTPTDTATQATARLNNQPCLLLGGLSSSAATLPWRCVLNECLVRVIWEDRVGGQEARSGRRPQRTRPPPCRDGGCLPP